MINNRLLLVSLGLAATSAAFAQTLFSDGGESLAGYTTVTSGADNEVRVVDYSNFTVAGVTHNIAEATNQIAGSASTTGILMRTNFDSAGVADGVNLILGGTPLDITASQYTLSFDMWLNIPVADFTGSTEQGIWGVGRSGSSDFVGRHTRTANGDGTWGWSAGEGGYGSEDFSAWTDTTNFGTLTDGSTEAQTAFGNNTLAGAPGGAWTSVDIVADNGNVQVFYNDVLFFDIDNAPTSGFAMVGYEDPFSSIAGEEGNLFMIVDNVEVEAVPEPATMTLLALGGLAALKRRKRK